MPYPGRSSVSVSSPVFANIDVNLSATAQTRGYREVLEAGRSPKADELNSRFKNQYTAAWAGSMTPWCLLLAIPVVLR
jgi:hypothetical protein